VTDSEQRPIREERRSPRDEVEEVAPGVLRVQLPISLPGLGHVNCYVLEDSKGLALVDPGLPGRATWRSLKSRLASASLPIDRVHTVIITHSHPDHFGQALRFQKRNGAEVITHESFRTFLDPTAEEDDFDTETVFESSPAETETNQAAAISGFDHASVQRKGPFAKVTPWGGKPYDLPISRKLRYWTARQLAGHFTLTPQPTIRVEEAEVLQLGRSEWVSVHTPGHTRDHLCLWNPENGVMISGDHVLPTITPHISGLGETADPLRDFFDSLDRMAGFQGVKTVLPAHGMEFTDLAARAEDIKAHHIERLDTIKEAGGRTGPATVQDYMRTLFKERSWGPMAESETYAHLEHLRILGEAKVRVSHHQLHYEIVD